jgi:hypothetical protein
VVLSMLLLQVDLFKTQLLLKKLTTRTWLYVSQTIVFSTIKQLNMYKNKKSFLFIILVNNI